MYKCTRMQRIYIQIFHSYRCVYLPLDLRGRRVSFSHLLSFSHSSISLFSIFSPPLSLLFFLIPSCHLLSPSLPTLLTIPPPSFSLLIISSPLTATFSLHLSFSLSLSCSTSYWLQLYFPLGTARGSTPWAQKYSFSYISSPSNFSLPAKSISRSDSLGDLKYFSFLLLLFLLFSSHRSITCNTFHDTAGKYSKR